MGLFAKGKMSKGMKALIFIPILLIISALFVSYFTLSGAVVLTTRGGLGNQIFQYSAAYSLSKATQSKLYVVVDRKSAEKGNVSPLDRNFGLLQFDIPQEQLIYSDSFFYKFVIVPTRTLFAKILSVDVKQTNFFQVKEKKNYKILFPRDYFESEIYFKDVEQDIRTIFDLKKLTNLKFENLLDSLQKENAVAIHIRRGDCDEKYLMDISYQRQAMALASKIIRDPVFYVFSDSVDQVKKELGVAENIRYVSDATMLPMDDFVLMANTSHNIMANSTFSWWAAYLNTNPNKLVITPYPFRKDELLKRFKDDRRRYEWKYLSYAGHLPKDWIALGFGQESLTETARKVLATEDYQNIFKDYQALPFKMYSGDMRQLTLCQQGDFKTGVCYLNRAEERPTVVTAYYQIPSKFGHEQYVEWAKNFLTMPFDLVVFTDCENAKWIKEARGNLPMVLVEKTMEEFYHYKYFADYKEMTEKDINKKHSPELYMIWAEKLKFVKEAISLNPYKANYFVWCDIGTFRKPQYRDETFPNAKYMWQDHMHFGLIKEFSLKNIETGVLDPEEDRVQGTMMVGDKQAWQVYNAVWDKMVDDLISEKELIGKDQHVMNHIALQFPWLIRLMYIDPRYKGNRWWYPLLYYTKSGETLKVS